MHGALLIKALQKQDAKAEFRCWGGDLIQAENATLVKHYKTLAFMGFWEVIRHLPTIFKNIAFCKKDLLSYQPDVIIYIDYPGFNLRIAKWAKQQGFKNHYYISPQVWAWKEKRVIGMKKYLDALYTILPFEKPFFEEKHQFPVHYVGHPLMERIPDHPHNPTFLQKHQLKARQEVIAILPGSRKQEIQSMLPVFLEVAKAFPKLQFVVAGAPGSDFDWYRPFLENSPLKWVNNQTYDLLQHAHAALVTSGTATLETALFKVPQIVCYKSSAISYWIGKRIITLKFISLVNLILDRECVKELIQHECTAESIQKQLPLLLDLKHRAEQLEAYKHLQALLSEKNASATTAALIYHAIQQKG